MKELDEIQALAAKIHAIAEAAHQRASSKLTGLAGQSEESMALLELQSEIYHDLSWEARDMLAEIDEAKKELTTNA